MFFLELDQFAVCFFLQDAKDIQQQNHKRDLRLAHNVFSPLCPQVLLEQVGSPSTSAPEVVRGLGRPSKISQLGHWLFRKAPGFFGRSPWKFLEKEVSFDLS